jgi:hypothetical protein
MLRLALLLALPAWSLIVPALARAGGRRAAWVATLVVALALAAWAGSRVGTANPVSRTARWDPWLVFAMGSVLLAIPGAGATWGALGALADGRPWWLAAGAGTLAGLVALPVAFAAAVLVEVLWPH